MFVDLGGKSLSIASSLSADGKISIWHTGVGKKAGKSSECLVFQSWGAKGTVGKEARK